MIFGITMYGLAAVAVLLAIYALTVLGSEPASWALAAFVGTRRGRRSCPRTSSSPCSPLVGVGSVWALRIGQSLLATRRLPAVPPVWRRTWLATGIALVATVALGPPDRARHRDQRALADVVAVQRVLAGDRGDRRPRRRARSWRSSSPGSWSARRRRSRPACTSARSRSWSSAARSSGAPGSRDFNTFHLFFGALAVFATPAAAVAVWSDLAAASRDDRSSTACAIALVVVCGVQLELGCAVRDRPAAGCSAPDDHVPVPLTILAAIESLPADAKLAYACLPAEEAAFWDAQLLGLDAHTGRRVVPMCFESETFGAMTGTPNSTSVASPLFRARPQRALYPTCDAKPSPAASRPS